MKRTCLAALLVIVACSAARSTIVDVVPTTPSREACTVGAWKCESNTPFVCARDEAGSAVTRWWPAHGRTSDGTANAPCRVRCVVDDGGPAHCAGDPDASTPTDASDGAVSQ